MKWLCLLATAALLLLTGTALARGYHGHHYRLGEAFGGSVIGSRPHYGWHSSNHHSQGWIASGQSTPSNGGYATPVYRPAPIVGNYSLYDGSNDASHSSNSYDSDTSR